MLISFVVHSIAISKCKCGLVIIINRPVSIHVVDFRSADWLPYVFKYRHALRAKYFGSRVFFSVWRPVWTASALDNWQIRYSAPKMEDAIIRSAHRR